MEDYYYLKLIEYFATRGFVQVSLVSALDGKRVQDNSAWMLSASASDKYCIIRISRDTYQERMEKLEYLQIGLEKMKEVFNNNNPNARLLDISINELGGSCHEGNVDFISLSKNANLDENVLEQFPDILDVFKQEKDEGFSVEKLKSVIDKKTLANRKAFIKARNRDSIPKSFTVISLICLVVFIGIKVLQYCFSVNDVNASIVCGGYYKAFITVLNQYYRFITSGFVHVSFYHLLTNLYSLLNLTRMSEKEFGFKKTIIILLTAIVMGSAFVFIGQDNIVTVGLSGGLYGLLGALTVVFFYKGYFKIPGMRKRFIINFGLNILISLLPNVSVLAHFGGFIAGLFLAAIFFKDSSNSLRINAIICGIILVGLVIVACVYFKDFNNYYFATDKQVYDIYQNLHIVKDNMKYLIKLFNYYGG